MFEKIRDLVAEQLGVNKDDIKPESRFGGNMGWIVRMKKKMQVHLIYLNLS